MNRASVSPSKKVGRPLAAAAVLALAVTAGCATGPQMVRTQVTHYNEWSALPTDRSFAFARTLEHQNSLEVKSYEDIVRDELVVKGFKYVAEPAQANLVVTLRPSSTMSQVRYRDSWPADPFWGGYGGFYGRRFGGWYGPFAPYGYGYGYDNFNSYPVDTVQRRLEMDIDSRTTAGKRYYEGRVETSSAADGYQDLAPAMVQALFSDFPGNNGQTRRIDVPIAKK